MFTPRSSPPLIAELRGSGDFFSTEDVKGTQISKLCVLWGIIFSKPQQKDVIVLIVPVVVGCVVSSSCITFLFTEKL